MRGTSGSRRGGDEEGKEVSRELRLDQYTSHSQMQRQQCSLEAEAEEDRKISTLISPKQESVNEGRRQPHVEMVGSHRAAEECLQRVVKHLLL